MNSRHGLHIQIRCPDGTYHGAEWPPSPLRLFQALIAGYRTASPPDPDAALEHLEQLPPPSITAPEAEQQHPVKTAVPNNDGDVILDHWAKGRDVKARACVAKLKTVRTRRPWRFTGPVTYSWETSVDTSPHVPGIQALASRLTVLGQGTDLAWATVATGALDRPGLVYRSATDGSARLQVPYPQAYAALEQRHRAMRDRIDGLSVRAVPEPHHRVVAYGSDLDPPLRRTVIFSLIEPLHERALAGEPLDQMDIAAMARHAVHEAARSAGLGESVISELMGHGGDGRMLCQPLPNVGHRYADGRLRRVLLSAPVTLGEEAWLAVTYRLSSAPLMPLGRDEPMALLVPIGPDDKLMGRYLGTHRAWTTATPLVLPGHDHRRGKPRLARMLRRLLKHADIPEALVEKATLEPAPVLRGSVAAQRARVPGHLQGLPRTHLTVHWRRPLAGPFALGAGAGYGFGVLAAL